MDRLSEEIPALLVDEPECPALPGWRCAGASVTGTSHLATGRPCQDAHALRLLGGTVIAVVSDGAGSARLAEAGSRAAADFTADRLEALLAEGPLAALDPLALLAEVRAHLEARAEALAASPRDLASTLLVAVAGPQEALFVQVGDGAVVFGDAELQVACWPDSGEYANETYFVTDAPPEHVQVRRVDTPFSRLALFTDGLQSLCLRDAERAVHAPFFEAFFSALSGSADRTDFDRAAFERALANTLSGPRLAARTDDDLTLLLALRPPA